MTPKLAALYRRVDELRRLWRVSMCPIDPFLICDGLPDVTLREFPFASTNMNASLVACEDGGYLITLNSRRTLREQVFDCAHELMHYALHPRGGISDSECEWQADQGALELLIPRDVLLHRIDLCRPALTGSNRRRFLSAQADFFGVTEAVFRRRLEQVHSESRGVHW